MGIIETLKTHCVAYDTNIPQILVCGDRSSGKSSVPNALTGIRLPAKGNLCTRYRLELILQKDVKNSFNVNIVPAPDRSETDEERLRAFEAPAAASNKFSIVIRSVDKAVGLKRNEKTILQDSLKLIVCGPEQPTLIFIDLPGFYGSPSPCHTTTIAEIANRYFARSGTVIPAVVFSEIDYDSQVLSTYLRCQDVSRKRMIGVITKPDAVVAGSEQEKNAMTLAGGRRVHFGLRLACPQKSRLHGSNRVYKTARRS